MLTSVLRRAIPALALVAITAACSFVISPPDAQCANTGDCAAKGGVFLNRQCRDGICVSPEDLGTTGCTSNAKCVQDNSGLPYACISPNTGAPCVSLLSEDCTDVQGPYDDDGAIFVGHFTLLDNDNIEYGKEDINILMLGFNEIQKFSGGIPFGERRRPIALVSCKWTDVRRAGDHLVNTVKVPAVIGLNDATKLSEFTNLYGREKGIFTMTPERSVVNANLPDNGLVWRNGGGPEVDDLLYLFAEELEPKIKAERSKSTIKVAMLVWNINTSLIATANNFTRDLRFNGKSVAENQTDKNFLRINYDPGNFDAVKMAADLFAFNPDIIIGANYADFPVTIAPEVERLYQGISPPYYIGNGFGEPLLGAEEAIGGIYTAGVPSITQRIRGFRVPAPETAVYQAFHDSFKEKLKKDPRPYQALYYEMAYFTAYAMAAAGNISTLTGTAMAEGFERIMKPGGTPLIIGPGDGSEIEKVFALVPFGAAAFEGPSGKITFSQRGDRNTSDFLIEGICYGNAGGTWQIGKSGQTLDVTNKKLVGTHMCP